MNEWAELKWDWTGLNVYWDEGWQWNGDDNAYACMYVKRREKHIDDRHRQHYEHDKKEMKSRIDRNEKNDGGKEKKRIDGSPSDRKYVGQNTPAVPQKNKWNQEIKRQRKKTSPQSRVFENAPNNYPFERKDDWEEEWLKEENGRVEKERMNEKNARKLKILWPLYKSLIRLGKQKNKQ